MEDILNRVLGLYMPTFLKMHIDTNGSLENLGNLSERDESIFAHEYIHFLQDISTYYGLANLCIVVDYIKYCCHQIIQNQSPTFNIPILPTSGDKFYTDKNLVLKKVYTGSTTPLNHNFSQLKYVYIIDSGVFLPDRPSEQVQTVKLIIDGVERFYGAHCIQESMAYISEEYLAPEQFKSTAFPYLSAEFVSYFIYPMFGNNRLNVLALCDCSLFTDNPGLNFVIALNRMKDEAWLPNTPKDVYEYCDKIFLTAKSLLETYEKILPLARDQISDYFTNENWKAIKNWSVHVLNEAYKIRATNKYFILELMFGGKIKTNSKFISLVNKLGYPLITNEKNEMYFGIPSGFKEDLKNMETLWAINQCYRIFIGKKDGCQMKSYCQESCRYSDNEDYTDSRCDSSPWDRTSDDKLCPFAQVWRGWGLQGRSPE